MSERLRVLLAPGYLLHQRPYHDTGRILEVFTREHGRLSIFARGVRGPRSQLAAVLQPFQRLLLSFTGRSEDAATLTAAEAPTYEPPLPGGSLMGAFYLNELLLKLTPRHDPAPEIFDDYAEALAGLREGRLEPTLRIFEKRLLMALGYGFDLTCTADDRAIEPDGHYYFQPGQGLQAAVPGPNTVAGSSLLGLAREELTSAMLEDARVVLRAALAECLEGRPLLTRAVARSVQRQSRRPRSSD